MTKDLLNKALLYTSQELTRRETSDPKKWWELATSEEAMEKAREAINKMPNDILLNLIDEALVRFGD